MSSGGCLIERFIIGHNSLNGRKKNLLTIHFCRLVTDSISKKIGYVVNNMAAILSNVQETGLQISISSLKDEIRELVIHHLRVTSAPLIRLTTCYYMQYLQR